MNSAPKPFGTTGTTVSPPVEMRLQNWTWHEVEDYLRTSRAIIVPTGSTEQHGPIGLIGTDSICATAIAEAVGERVGALVTPPLCYTPAPFNLAFPGTISVSEATFEALVRDILDSLNSQGFTSFYFLNGHGANLDPLRAIESSGPKNARIRVVSWWEFARTNALRQELFGAWEGVHATPSEISITQAIGRVIDADDVPESRDPPEWLSPEYLKACAGDRHGPPDAHKARFPDGRVGSHSALASPGHGTRLMQTAVAEIADDFAEFAGLPMANKRSVQGVRKSDGRS